MPLIALLSFIEKNSTTTTALLDCNGDVTEMSNPERILRDGHRITTTSNSAQAVGNTPTAFQSFEALLPEVATTSPSTKGQGTFDAMAD